MTDESGGGKGHDRGKSPRNRGGGRKGGAGTGGGDGSDGRLLDATAAMLLRQFEMRDEGLFWQPPDGNKLNVHVCGKIEAVARARDQFGEQWGVLLAFLDPGGRRHEWAMPRALLAGGGDAVREYLLSRELYISPDQIGRQALIKWLSIVVPNASARCVAQIGWHQGSDKVIFVHRIYAMCDQGKLWASGRQFRTGFLYRPNGRRQRTRCSCNAGCGGLKPPRIVRPCWACGPKKANRQSLKHRLAPGPRNLRHGSAR